MPLWKLLLGVAVLVGSNHSGVAQETGVGKARVNQITDGPHVFWKDATTAEVLTIVNGELKRRTYSDLSKPRQVEGLPGAEPSIWLYPTVPATEASNWDLPEKLLAISDLEGNYNNTTAFLMANKVLDAKKKWAWGKGHLVLVGDLVDRGSQVTELMHFLRRLQREAKAAGGRVHYVLGNHEVMVMAGDYRYADSKYMLVAHRMGLNYADLYGPKTDVGRWWRSQNTILKIGEYLFVHAGYSPTLEAQKLAPDEVNEAIRNSLKMVPGDELPKHADLIGSGYGPLWYRGYFPKYASGFGGLVKKNQLAETLARHEAKFVVVGHSVVDQAGTLPNLPSVIAIDTKWTDLKKAQGLLVVSGKRYVVDGGGKRQPLGNASGHN